MPHYDSRLGCSTISFRHQALPQALATIAGLGFTEIDLGALPGVCDHVPTCSTCAPSRTSPGPSSRPACGCARSTATSATSMFRSTTALRLTAAPPRHARRAGRRYGCASTGAAVRGHRPHPGRHPRSRRGAGRRCTRRGSRRRGLARGRAVDRVAAPTSAVLEHRARAIAHRSAGRHRRRRHGLQPCRGLRRRPRRVRRPVRAAHPACPHPRRRARETSTSLSATARSTSQEASRHWPTTGTPATSRSSWRPATSPTINDPRRPPQQAT